MQTAIIFTHQKTAITGRSAVFEVLKTDSRTECYDHVNKDKRAVCCSVCLCEGGEVMCVGSDHICVVNELLLMTVNMVSVSALTLDYRVHLHMQKALIPPSPGTL